MTNIAHERLITNKLLLDHLNMWDEFDIKSVDDNKTVRYYNRIMNHIDDEIEAGLKWLDSEEAEKYFKGESQYHHKVFQSLEDEWDSILEGKYPSVETLLDEVYRRGKAKGYTDMREHVRYTEADKQALRIATEYNYHLINKIDNDVRTEIKNKIISGFLAGDNPNVIAPKIQYIAGEQLEGSTFTPRQRATMIAKTEISRVQNTGMLQSYVNEGYTEVKILTAEDNNVCAICLEYAYEFNKDDDLIYGNHGKEKIHNIIELIKGGSFPPFHPLCRCTYLSVWKTKTKPPKKPFIICLIPTAYGMKVPQNLKDSHEIVIKFSRDQLEEYLNEIVDDSDELKIILDLLNKNFRNKVYNTSYEWGAGIGMDGECQKTYSNWLRNKVFLSEILLDAAKNKGILTFIHSHPFTTSPLASFKDYELFAKNKVKYGIVTNEFGMMIIKNKNVAANYQNSKTINDVAMDIEFQIKTDFEEKLGN